MGITGSSVKGDNEYSTRNLGKGCQSFAMKNSSIPFENCQRTSGGHLNSVALNARHSVDHLLQMPDAVDHGSK
jgi:hypothetical protein